MKILVTGSTGLLNAYLLEQLVSKHFSVKAIFYDTEPKLNREIIKQIEWVKADIRDIHSLQHSLSDIDQIYHCVHVPSKKYSCKEKKSIYFNGTKNIVNLAITHHIKKLLYVSVPSTLQTINEKGFITEQLPHSSLLQFYNKQDILYHETEKQIWRGMAEGLHSVIINPTHILDIVDDWNTTDNLFKQVYQNIFLGAYPLGYNGFVMLENVVQAMLLLMPSNISNERFIINAENMSYKTIFSLIQKGFNKPIAKDALTKNKTNKIIFINYLSHLLNNNHLIINKNKLMKMNESYQYDNSKFLKHFKHFEYKPITENIEKICQSYKQKFRLK